jgi:hypothetical protein
MDEPIVERRLSYVLPFNFKIIYIGGAPDYYSVVCQTIHKAAAQRFQMVLAFSSF